MCAIDSSDFASRELFDVLIGHGLRHVVISPGSRDTALILASSSRKNLRKHIIADERTAAFTALGIAQASQTPAALVCTSGTALYNYAPAVAEAFYQKIPLIVISADRPAQWIGQDDSQTMVQSGALSDIVKKSFDIPPAGSMANPTNCENFSTEWEWYVNRVANEAFNTATSGIAGPVHVNMQFAMPFNGTTDYSDRHPRIIINESNDISLPPHRMREVAESMMEKRVLLVAGFMPPDNSLNKAVNNFCSLPNVAVIAEPLSNLHISPLGYNAQTWLTRLTPEEKGQLKPDLIITIGGALVSAEIKKFLRDSDGASHWTLADTPIESDCYMRLTRHFEVSPYRFLSSAFSMINHLRRKGKKIGHPNFGDFWRKAAEKNKPTDKKLLSTSPWSDLRAAETLFSSIPRDYNVFLSNGMTVRYAGMFLDTLPHACFGNRGVSGIDGTNATAAGCSRVYRGTTLLVTGDMSFSYCPEILSVINEGCDLRIIVFCNQGGGIFRVVKTTRDLPIKEEYICCDPKMPLEALAKAYGWNYAKANNDESFQEALRILKECRNTIVEVVTNPEISANATLEFMKGKIR